MSTSAFDAYRPPQPERRRRFDASKPFSGPKKRKSVGASGDGSREMSMVEDIEFDSYYGRPIVKAPPWKHEIGIYFFLGGVAGGSSLLALGAQARKLPRLRRNTRITALAASGVGALALIKDLGRPERFLNMMRTFKITSPMSVGSWILMGFSSFAAIPAIAEVDRATGSRLPLPRRLLTAAEPVASVGAAALAAPLATYTAVLIGDTANPVWNAGRRELPYLFASSASLAASGVAMVTTPTAEIAPAQKLAVAGVVGDVAAMHLMKERMHPAEREPLETGKPGKMLKAAEVLAIAGGATALLARVHRVFGIASGLMLAGASALTRFGVLEAGLESTHDPRHVVEPQKARLAARRAAGITDDSITTAG